MKQKIEYPIITYDNFYINEKTIIIHSHINQKGKMILNESEALLLIAELYKFVKINNLND